jgi:D-alanine-D-alanine ligase
VKIGILYGGRSAEREVSLSTGKAVFEAIIDDYNVEMILLDGEISSILNKLKEFDLIFLALHGGEGENGIIQQFLETHNILYTGSDPIASRLAMDKAAAKKIALKNDIPTPNWHEIQILNGNYEMPHKKETNFPIVVKPNEEGSTVGLSIVKNASHLQSAIDQAANYSNNILLEEYIPGTELTVGILGDDILPIIEIIPNHGLFDFECKYTKGMTNYHCPADLPPALAREIQNAANSVFTLLGCRHYARVDFRMSPDNNFYFLELNTLPGFTDTSLLPMSAKEIGLSYKDLVNKVILYATGEK